MFLFFRAAFDSLCGVTVPPRGYEGIWITHNCLLNNKIIRSWTYIYVDFTSFFIPLDTINYPPTRLLNDTYYWNSSWTFPLMNNMPNVVTLLFLTTEVSKDHSGSQLEGTVCLKCEDDFYQWVSPKLSTHQIKSPRPSQSPVCSCLPACLSVSRSDWTQTATTPARTEATATTTTWCVFHVRTNDVRSVTGTSVTGVKIQCSPLVRLNS